MLAEVLLNMRGVELPSYSQIKPGKRGERQRQVLDALRNGATTGPEVADTIHMPDLPRRYVLHRVYMALTRLEAKGLVVRDRKEWKIR